jgi:translation initiation factor 1
MHPTHGKISIKINMPTNSRTVYTTQSGRICPNCGKPVAACTCKKKTAVPSGGDGVVRVALEKKGRGGKTVSVITGLPLSGDALRDLASDLKRRCGTGGTVKDGVIEIQGDHRDTLTAALKEHGYHAKKAGG